MAPQGGPPPGGAPQPPMGAPPPGGPPGGGQALSATAQPTGNPFTDAQATLKSLAQGINAANPGKKWKPDELIDAMNMAVTAGQGIMPDQKLLMQGELAQAKIDAATHDAIMKADTAQEVARIKADSAQKIADARAATAEAVQALKDATAERDTDANNTSREKVGAGHDTASTANAGTRAGATIGAATIGANSREKVGAGHDAASVSNAGTRAGATTGAAATAAAARTHAADVAHPQGAKAIADRQALVQAREAISKGAPKEAVIAKLKTMGVNPAGL